MKKSFASSISVNRHQSYSYEIWRVDEQQNSIRRCSEVDGCNVVFVGCKKT